MYEDVMKRISIEYNEEINRFYGLFEFYNDKSKTTTEFFTTTKYSSASLALAALCSYYTSWQRKVTLTDRCCVELSLKETPAMEEPHV